MPFKPNEAETTHIDGFLSLDADYYSFIIVTYPQTSRALFPFAHCIDACHA